MEADAVRSGHRYSFITQRAGGFCTMTMSGSFNSASGSFDSAPTAVTRYSLACAHELLTLALDIVDQSGLPGEVGAHLDHSIHVLRRCIAPQLPPIPKAIA